MLDWNLLREDELCTLPEALVAVQAARAHIEKLEAGWENYNADQERLNMQDARIKELEEERDELRKNLREGVRTLMGHRSSWVRNVATRMLERMEHLAGEGDEADPDGGQKGLYARKGDDRG